MAQIRNILVLCLSVVSVISSYAQSSSDIQAYISQYKDIAIAHEKEYGIPASIIMAQGILESGAGTSLLATEANNHFGIKAGANWKGGIYLAWDDEIGKSRFRRYISAADSYKDHVVVLKGDRYSSLFDKSVYDYRSWAFGLQKLGYATAPNYAKALIGYIDAYKLYALNGGVKLKPGKQVTITKYVTTEQPIFEEEWQIEDSAQTEEEEAINNTINRFIVEINDVRCTLLYPGESISSISMKYNIPKDKILEFNEISTDSNIKDGDVIFLGKKKSKYRGARDYYTVQDEDTLYSISQQFGIRLHSLAKMNDLDLFSKLKSGQRLRLK